MKILNMLAENIVKTACKAKIMAMAKSPEILLAGGIASIVGGTVVAIVKTSEADDAMDEFNRNIDRIKETIEAANKKDNPEQFYPVEQQQKDYRFIYGHMIMTMAKIYLPVIILETFGIFMICKSHSILNKRNASLAAAYASLMSSFNEYRKRVRDKYGDEEEQRIYYGYQENTTLEKITSENGITSEAEKKEVTYNPLSPFSILISQDTSDLWDKDPYITWSNLKIKQRELNDILWCKKFSNPKKAFITFNEVAKTLGVEERPEWATFVIYRDEKNPDKINFGLDNKNVDQNVALHRFLNRLEPNVWIDIRPDGNICDDFQTQFRAAKLKEECEDYDKGRKVLV